MRKQLNAINEANNQEERVYKISALPRVLNSLEKVLSAIQQLGHVGASRNLNVFVDGDGATRLKVSRTDKVDMMRDEINTDLDTINFGME